MFPVTIGFSFLLIALGLGFFVGTAGDQYHPTALIPTGFGLAFLVLGLLSRRDKLRMHVMHAAATLALIGVVGGAVMGLPKTFTMLGGSDVERPTAVIEQDLLAVLCLVYVGLCVKSFMDSRRRRKQTATNV